MEPTFWGKLSAETQAAIVGVDKYQQSPQSDEDDPATGAKLQKTTDETIWLPSVYEVYGMSFLDYNESEALTTVVGYVPFQYMAYQLDGASDTNTHAIKTYNGSINYWWLRSVRQGNTFFCHVTPNGSRSNTYATYLGGAAPCFAL